MTETRHLRFPRAYRVLPRRLLAGSIGGFPFQQLPDQIHASPRIAPVPVRSDVPGKLLVERRTAHHNLDLITQPAGDKGIDGFFHLGHGGGQQGGHPQNVRPFSFNRCNETLRRDVDAEVHHLETDAAQHGGHHVLADVVQVAAHRAKQDFAANILLLLCQIWFEHDEGLLHGPGREQHLGDEHRPSRKRPLITSMALSMPRLRISLAFTPWSSSSWM